MPATPSEATFTCRDVECAADVYFPDGEVGRAPCVVLGHGFSGTKGLARVYAERFAAAGFAVLVFDYRHFGASGGQPRQIVDVERQREDYRAAVAFARTRDDIDPDRIALWGTSLSGGHVIAVAADDPRIVAVVAQVPLIDGWRTGRSARESVRRALTRSTLKLLAAAVRDALRALRKRPPCLARVVGRPGEAAVYTDPRVAAIFAELGGEAVGWRNAFAPRFLFALPRYREGTAERVRAPLLVCLAEHDLEASPDFAAAVATRAPRGEVRRYPVGHFDVYVEPVRSQIIADQIAFLRNHLRP